MAALALLTMAGCSGGTPNTQEPNPPPPVASTQYYTYIGTQSPQSPQSGDGLNSNYGGFWSLDLDANTDYFKYMNLSHGGDSWGVDGTEHAATIPATVLGNFAGTGFLSLTPLNQSAGSGGYALQVAGQAAALRPGDNTVAPVLLASSSSCPIFSGMAGYRFIALGTTDPNDNTDHVDYGSIQVGNSGTTINFSSLQMYTWSGTSLSPAQWPTGACANGQGGEEISIASSAATNNSSYAGAIEPSGFFVMDQGQGEQTWYSINSLKPAIGPTGPLGLVGVAIPSAQLDTSQVVAAKYIGFEFEPIEESFGHAGTWPVAFGQTPGSNTVMIGGIYPNDDVTQTPATNITIDLGQQDTENGLYKNVTVVVPDVHGGCLQQPYGGTDANGNNICTFQGVAVAGNPNGKYAIFVSVNDLSEQTNGGTPLAALEFFLYQQ